jgi:chemotaxis methyl-accepting protein methylase
MASPRPLDVREVWFSNMHLLGLQPALCEEKYQVIFERDMFEYINKKGSEAVLHFLFSKLDPQLSGDVFR